MDLIMLLFVAVFIILTAIYVLNQQNAGGSRIASMVNKFPGPKSYPFFGSNFELLFVKREDIFGLLRKRCMTYAPVFRTWLGSFPVIHLLTAEHIELVLKSSVNIEKGFTYNNIRPWLGDGLLTSTGSKWHRHRKLLTPTFHFKILEQFVDIFVEKSEILTQQLAKKADGQTVFDVFPYITRCALDIICKTAMGIEVNAMAADRDNEYVNAVYGMCEEVVQKSNKPWLHSDFIFYKTEHGRRYKKYLQILHDTTNKVIRERKQILQNKKTSNVKEEGDEVIGAKRRVAFLDLLLEASQEGNILTHEQIREEVDTFLFEGHDTTTAGICWTLFLLGLHQDVQEEVYQEIVNTLPESRTPSLAELGELKLLERVVKESLRIYPSVGTISRKIVSDVDLGDYIIPAGCGVTINIFEVHRNPKYFPEPEKFDPDRFLPENINSRHPYAFIPFSAGPRNCIGQRFALFEEKTVLSNVLKKFKVKSMQTRETVQPVLELILRPFKGLLVTLEPRKLFLLFYFERECTFQENKICYYCALLCFFYLSGQRLKLTTALKKSLNCKSVKIICF